MNNILITNVQRFSLHDGPGIRTTVFLKGCSLHCPWCSNPECIIPRCQKYKKNDKVGIYGYYISWEQLANECLKDKAFYIGIKNNRNDWSITNSSEMGQLPGGVTFSGGEALLQAEALIPIFETLRDENIHQVVETSLFITDFQLDVAMKYIDMFYVDIKILDSERCKKIINGDIAVFLKNFHKLMSWQDREGKRKPVIVRIPVIGKRTDDIRNRQAIKKLIEEYSDKIIKIEFVKEHSLGESKYRSLNMDVDFFGVEDAILESYLVEFKELLIPMEICKI